jgi:hypothetical protein
MKSTCKFDPETKTYTLSFEVESKVMCTFSGLGNMRPETIRFYERAAMASKKSSATLSSVRLPDYIVTDKNDDDEITKTETPRAYGRV